MCVRDSMSTDQRQVESGLAVIKNIDGQIQSLYGKGDHKYPAVARLRTTVSPELLKLSEAELRERVGTTDWTPSQAFEFLGRTSDLEAKYLPLSKDIRDVLSGKKLDVLRGVRAMGGMVDSLDALVELIESSQGKITAVHRALEARLKHVEGGTRELHKQLDNISDMILRDIQIQGRLVGMADVASNDKLEFLKALRVRLPPMRNFTEQLRHNLPNSSKFEDDLHDIDMAAEEIERTAC